MLDAGAKLRRAAWPDFLAADSAQARAHREAMLTRIQRTHKAGNRAQLRYLIQQHLTSCDSRLAVKRLASRKMRWDRRPKKTELKFIAENLHAFQGTREYVSADADPARVVRGRGHCRSKATGRGKAAQMGRQSLQLIAEKREVGHV